MATLTLRLQAFAGLPKADRARIDSLSRRAVRDLPARRDLVREGERPRSVFILLDGWACRYRMLPDGRRQIVALLLPGDPCDPVLSPAHEADHSVGSITAISVAEIGRDEFEQMLDQHPRIVRALYQDQLAKSAIQREWAVNLGQRSSYERISHLMCETVVRLRSVGLSDGRSCTFPLTQVDLADATGLTAVHVNRTLQELRHDGIIALQSRTLIVPDLARLKAAALFNDSYLHLGREGAKRG